MAATKSSFPAVVVLRAPTHLFRHESTALSKSFVALPKSPSLSLIRPQLKIFAIFSSSPPIPTQTLPNLAQTPDTASALVVMIVVGIAITIQLSKILAPKTPQFSLKLEGSLRDPVPFSLELFYSSGISEWGPGPAAMPIVVVSAVLVIRGLLTWLANIPWESAMRHLLIIPPGDLTLKLAFLLLDMLWHLARRPRSH